MKIITMIIFCCMLLTGCNSSNITESSAIEKFLETEIAAEITTEIAEPVTETDSILSDNIQEINLKLPENSAYLNLVKKFTYNEEYELPDGRKIVEDKSIYLEETSGERTVLIEIPEEQTQQYAVFCDMIDSNRFYYYIIWHESTAGMGIYNLETGEDFRIDKSEDGWHYIPKKVIGNNLLLVKSKIASCGGIARLSLDNYEITDFECSFMKDDKNYSFLDFSPDGNKAALFKRAKAAENENDMNEYTISIYSLYDDKILNQYTFKSKHNYINYRLLYYSENQVYLYVYQYGEFPKNYLYIIDLY